MPACSIHDEYVVHGSAGNETDGHRRTYVCAFRTADTVARERALGFDHSHNTGEDWTELNCVLRLKSEAPASSDVVPSITTGNCWLIYMCHQSALRPLVFLALCRCSC